MDPEGSVHPRVEFFLYGWECTYVVTQARAPPRVKGNIADNMPRTTGTNRVILGPPGPTVALQVCSALLTVENTSVHTFSKPHSES